MGSNRHGFSKTISAMIVGYHGCDQSVADRRAVGRSVFRASDNDYDWLGRGIYFWEFGSRSSTAVGPGRSNSATPRRSRNPAQVGALIHLRPLLRSPRRAINRLFASGLSCVCAGPTGQWKESANQYGGCENKAGDLLLRRLGLRGDQLGDRRNWRRIYRNRSRPCAGVFIEGGRGLSGFVHHGKNPISRSPSAILRALSESFSRRALTTERLGLLSRHGKNL